MKKTLVAFIACKECGALVPIQDLIAQMWCGYCGRFDFCTTCKEFHIAPETGCKYKQTTTGIGLLAMQNNRKFVGESI